MTVVFTLSSVIMILHIFCYVNDMLIVDRDIRHTQKLKLS